MLTSKKGQSGGFIMGLVFGISSLVIAVIITFVIVSTLTGANLLVDGRTTATVTNESGAYINSTGYQLDGLDTNYVPGTITISSVYNNTDSVIILSGNYTVSSTGLLTNATTTTWSDVNVTYSSSVYSNEEVSSDYLSGNYTEGVDNVSEKVPTVLLIAAIVLVLSILALLVGAWQSMRMGGGTSI